MAAGIVLLLAGMLVPVIQGVVRKKQDVICVGRLHMLYLALAAYTNDYDRRLPLTHYCFPERDDPELLRTIERIARQRGLPFYPPDPSRYKPPWPPGPPPPGWYTWRVGLNDYVDDPSVFFCPGHPKSVYPPAPPGIENATSYTYNSTLAAAAVDELTWPLEEVRVAFCPMIGGGKLGHIGNRINVLRLDGSVKKSKMPLMTVCAREPWEMVRERVEAADWADSH